MFGVLMLSRESDSKESHASRPRRRSVDVKAPYGQKPLCETWRLQIRQGGSTSPPMLPSQWNHSDLKVVTTFIYCCLLLTTFNYC